MEGTRWSNTLAFWVCLFPSVFYIKLTLMIKLPPQVVFHMLNGMKGRTSYLYTIKRVCDFRRIFHFEEGAQVSSSVEKLNLKSFVSKGNLTADKKVANKRNKRSQNITYFNKGHFFKKIHKCLYFYIKCRVLLMYLGPRINAHCYYGYLIFEGICLPHHRDAGLKPNTFLHYATAWLRFSNYTHWNN